MASGSLVRKWISLSRASSSNKSRGKLLALDDLLDDHLLNVGKYKPDIAQSEQRTGNDTQFPCAFAPANQLGCAIYSHGKDQQYPEPPGNTRQALFAKEKNKADHEHGS